VNAKDLLGDFNKTMFTNFLDTPFPVDVEIGEPILQGKTVFSERGWFAEVSARVGGFGFWEMTGVIT
jgi:hypothetical protein